MTISAKVLTEVYTSVEDLHKTKVRFQDFVQRLVLRFVVLNSQEEVVEDGIVLGIFVVGTVNLNFLNGSLDDLGIVADRFDKQQLVAHLLHYDAVNHPTAISCRVRGIEDLFGTRISKSDKLQSRWVIANYESIVINYELVLVTACDKLMSLTI